MRFAHKNHLRCEIFIMIAIIIGLMVLVIHHNIYTTSYLQIDENGQIRMMNHEYVNNVTYNSHTTELIIVSDSNYKITDYIWFEPDVYDYNRIISHPSLKQMIVNQPEGNLDIIIGGHTINVCFTWVECNDTKYLIQTIVDHNKMIELIFISIVSYGILIMCYIVLLIMIYYQIKGVSNKYEESANSLYDIE